MLRFVRSHLTACCFLLLLAAAELTYSMLSGHDQHALRAWASTSVTNLKHHPLGALVSSAFIPSEHPLGWLLLAALGMFSADGMLGWRRSLVLVAAAHLLGSLVSEGVVAWRVAQGALPHASLSLDDVGPSYLVASALTFALLYGWVRGSPAWVRGLRPVAGLLGLVALRGVLFSGLSHLDVTAVGHTVSMVTAALLGGALLRGRAGRPAAVRAPAPARSGHG
ncbi:MAG: hypothetical protein DLM59_19920 [Pseudonocardiales bacterium]|nr:MAG: hypothetical protein DLM59_19920 [Pseudonocardiales bacterium]